MPTCRNEFAVCQPEMPLTNPLPTPPAKTGGVNDGPPNSVIGSLSLLMLRANSAALHVSPGDRTPKRAPVFQFCGYTKRGSPEGPKRIADLNTVSAFMNPCTPSAIGKAYSAENDTLFFGTPTNC